MSVSWLVPQYHDKYHTDHDTDMMQTMMSVSCQCHGGQYFVSIMLVEKNKRKTHQVMNIVLPTYNLSV